MKLILLVSLALLTSCSSRVQTAAGRLISPEAQGESWGGVFNATAETTAAYEVDFTNNRTNAPLKHEKTTGGRQSLGMELGAFRPVDVLISMGSPTPYLGLKYQFLGATKKEAKQGTFAASVVGFAGSTSRSTKSSEFFTDAADNVKKVEYTQNSRSYGLIVGYRVFNPLLVYFGSHRTYEDVDGRVTTKDLTLDEARFGYGNSAYLHNVGIIYHAMTNHLVTKLEFSSLATKWTRTSRRTDNGLSFAIGFEW